MYFLQIFRNYKLFEIFLLGIISGIPLSIILIVITTWLKEVNVSLEIITMFFGAKLFYCLKPFWAPFIDYFALPIFSKFGKRKTWMLTSMWVMAIILAKISNINPIENLVTLYLLTLSLGFCSANFDMNFDSFRIEQIVNEQQELAAANSVLGHRVGMQLITVSVFYYVDMTKDWHSAFLLMSIFLAIAALFISTIKETEVVISNKNNVSFYSFTIDSFKNLLTKDYVILFLISIVFFRIGDIMFSAIAIPFYLDLGYSKTQIANISVLYAILATAIGAYFGAFLTHKFGHIKAIIITGFIQITVSFFFMWLKYQPITTVNLAIVVTINKLAITSCNVAVIAYLALICDKKYSATQYALLTSLPSFCNTIISLFTGSMVVLLGWNNYFIFITLLGLLPIIIVTYINKKMSIKC